jgi:hypothetical protein
MPSCSQYTLNNDGAFDGWKEGALLGSEVGILVGFEGMRDGISVGFEGLEVGILVGFEGMRDGTLVGFEGL